MFEEYYNELNNYCVNYKNNLVEMVDIIPSNKPNINLNILKRNIDNTDNMSDVELRRFIHDSYEKILETVFTPQLESTKYINKFQDMRFLDAFIDVTNNMLNTVRYLDRIIIVRINTICYHYITLPSHMRNNNIMMRMIELSNLINRNEKPKLLGLGLSNDLASLLIIARNSDTNLDVCVKRVNFTLITQPPSLMSEKMLEDIMRILYNIFSNDFVKVFECMMFDVTERSENDVSTYWITDDIEEVNSTLNLVLLNIVEQLPSDMIRKILSNYADSKNIARPNEKVRFSLQTINNDDYGRIKFIIDCLYNEGIYVP